MMKKLKNSFTFLTLEAFFRQKRNLLVYLLLFLGVLLPALSGSDNYNFWYRIYYILISPFYNAMFYLAIGISTIYMIGEFSKSYTIASRCSDYRAFIKNNMKSIIVQIMYLFVVSFILVIAGAIFFSFNNFGMINHPDYALPIIYYILVYLIRSFLFCSLVTLILYLLFLVVKKVGATVLVLINSSCFYLLLFDVPLVKHFYNMPLLYQYYYGAFHCSTFGLEIICSTLEFIILYIIYKIISRIVLIKKRDLA